jgi:hypothetical protein
MTFDQFMTAVRALLEPSASGKGYNQTGADGRNDLYEFVREMNGDHSHALGEIVYKARRFAARRDPVDALKIAAWAFLILKHEHAAAAQGDGDAGHPV